MGAKPLARPSSIGTVLALVTAAAISARTRLALPQYRLAEGEL